MKPALTVVIPTFNRTARLKATLRALIDQSLDKKLFEIVIVDDGSDDGTREMVADFSKQVEHYIRYYWQENQRAGSARNLGILEAKSPLILLMDDDIILNRDHLTLHFGLHMKYAEPEVAVRGRVTVGSRGIDLLRWDESDFSPIGSLSNREMIISPGYFVTAAVSLKREFLMKAGLFTPGLPFEEDTDLSLRMRDFGLKLIYCREAVGIHTEPIDTLEKVVNSGRKYGRTLAEWRGRIPLYRKEIWRLGARLNGGWHHFSQHPWGYIKDAIRRWTINKYTIKAILGITRRIPITNPPHKVLRRCCKEVWAYYYRDEFRKRRRNLHGNSSGS
jgi:glycosyltransferase involved in cell wall biosynthesis